MLLMMMFPVLLLLSSPLLLFHNFVFQRKYDRVSVTFSRECSFHTHFTWDVAYLPERRILLRKEGVMRRVVSCRVGWTSADAGTESSEHDKDVWRAQRQQQQPRPTFFPTWRWQVKKEWTNPATRNSFALPFINFILKAWLVTQWKGETQTGDLATVLFWIGSAPLAAMTVYTIARYLT